MRRFLPGYVTCCVCLYIAACSSRDADETRALSRGTGAATDGNAPLPQIPGHARLPVQPAGGGLGLHSVSPPGPPDAVFGEHGGVAEVVEKDGRFRVIHDGRAGKAYAVAGEVALSADGRRCAYGALVDGKWRMVLDGKEGAPFDAVKLPVFSPDGSHLAYQAMRGELWHLVVDSTVNAGTRTRYLSHDFSADSSRIAFVDEVDDQDRGRLVVSDLAFRKQTVVASGVSQMLLDATRSRLAAIVASGAQLKIVTLRLGAPGRPVEGAAYDAVFDPVFGPDGSVAYVAERSGRRFVVLDDQVAPVVAGHVMGTPVVIPGRRAVGLLLTSLSGNVLVQEYFVDEKPRDASYEEAEGLVYSRDGRLRTYAARRGASWFVVVNGKEGPPFDRVVSPVFSPDGRFLAYRARKDGKRFAVVANTGTDAIATHPAHEQVFPVRFAADGKSIAYGVKDGTQVAWKVEAP